MPDDATPPRLDYWRYVEFVAHFYRRVLVTETCWLWRGKALPTGYGAISDGFGKVEYAHRLSYAIHKGPIPPGLFVCHTCDTPRCVRPDHLFLGTPAQNSADMAAKGRQVSTSLFGRDRLPPTTKITPEVAALIRHRYAAGGVTQRALATEYGLTQGYLSKIVRRVAWGSHRDPTP